MQKLLSIIIPVYNVERYLSECIDSFLPECNDTCEIILVDDGSPDRCPAICDDYAAKYAIVKAIHQANGGLAAARNTGLADATGKYVAFVDSDDRLSGGALTQTLARLQGEPFDLCFMQCVKFFPDGARQDLGDGITSAGIADKDKLAVLQYLASRPKYTGAAWSKIYRNQFLKENGLRFPDDRRLSEDLGFVRDCILQADTYEALDCPYYEYRQGRAGSITDSVSEKRLQGLALFLEESIALLTVNRKPVDANARCAMSFAAYEYAVLLLLYASSSQKTKNEWYPVMKSFHWVLQFASCKKTTVIKWLVQILGIRITSKIIKVVKS